MAPQKRTHRAYRLLHEDHGCGRGFLFTEVGDSGCTRAPVPRRPHPLVLCAAAASSCRADLSQTTRYLCGISDFTLRCSATSVEPLLGTQVRVSGSKCTVSSFATAPLSVSLLAPPHPLHRRARRPAPGAMLLQRGFTLWYTARLQQPTSICSR